MAIIYSYPAGTPSAADNLLGTQVDPITEENKTVQFGIGAINSLATQGYLETTVTLTNAQWIALPGTDVQLVATPGADKLIKVLALSMFFDYATDFRFENDTIPENFIFSDDQYKHFEHYLSDKEYNYKTKTEQALEKVKQKAIDEGYFEALSEDYDNLLVQLEANKGDDLFSNKQDLKEILTGEISSRYFYQEGRIKSALNFDSELKKAIEVLQDEEMYNGILGNE